MVDLEQLLRAAFDAGVEAGDSGYAEQPDELDISFAVFVQRAARRASHLRVGHVSAVCDEEAEGVCSHCSGASRCADCEGVCAACAGEGVDR